MLTVKSAKQRKDNAVLNLDYVMGIYMIRNKITGDCYIGQSTNIPNRIKDHFRTTRAKPSKVQSQVIQYGKENFEIILLAECKTESELDEQEKYWIDLLNPSLNQMAGGRKNKLFHHNEETIRVLSEKGKKHVESLNDEERRKLYSHLTGPKAGHPVSKVTREKLSAARAKQDLATPEILEKRRQTMERKKAEGWVKAKPKEPVKRTPIVCNETGEHFNSIAHASSVMGICRWQIYRQMQGKVAKAKGYSFSREV